MPIINDNDQLLNVMNQWNIAGTNGCVILVDETTGDADVSNDRAGRHRLQSVVINRAVRYGFPIFLVNFGLNGAHGDSETFAAFGGISVELDNAVPGATLVYKKGGQETNGFDNINLGPAVQAANCTDAIIMGQSRNACCKATATGAAALGLNIHTTDSITRGGGVATAPHLNFVAPFGWPNGTRIYAGV